MLGVVVCSELCDTELLLVLDCAAFWDEGYCLTKLDMGHLLQRIWWESRTFVKSLKASISRCIVSKTSLTLAHFGAAAECHSHETADPDIARCIVLSLRDISSIWSSCQLCHISNSNWHWSSQNCYDLWIEHSLWNCRAHAHIYKKTGLVYVRALCS